jgi:hypothetical protein
MGRGDKTSIVYIWMLLFNIIHRGKFLFLLTGEKVIKILFYKDEEMLLYKIKNVIKCYFMKKKM